MVRLVALLIVVAVLGQQAIEAQTVSAEYRVKAAYLYNFLKFVEFPDAGTGPLVICVAGRNPFGTLLGELVRDEVVGTRRIEARVILEPEPGCHILFVPNAAATRAYLRAARDTPTMTVGESDTFIARGGVANFYIEGENVRFEISPAAAARAKLRISSRLLNLARLVDASGETR